MHTSNACLKRILRYLRICTLLAFVCFGACEAAATVAVAAMASAAW